MRGVNEERLRSEFEKASKEALEEADFLTKEQVHEIVEEKMGDFDGALLDVLEEELPRDLYRQVMHHLDSDGGAGASGEDATGTQVQEKSIDADTSGYLDSVSATAMPPSGALQQAVAFISKAHSEEEAEDMSDEVAATVLEQFDTEDLKQQLPEELWVEVQEHLTDPDSPMDKSATSAPSTALENFWADQDGINAGM